MSDEPLAGNEQFRTGDLDLIREASGRVLVPHRVKAFGKVSPNAHMNAARLGGTTLAYFNYQSQIQLEAPTTDAMYFIAVPLTGRAAGLRGSRETAESWPGTGLAYLAEEHGVLDFSDDYTMFFLRIKRAALEDRLQGLLGRDIVGPLRLDFSMDLRSRALRTWMDCVRLLSAELERGVAEQHPLVGAHIEDLVLTSLLCGQPHNYSDLLQEGHQPVRPRTIKHAIDLIELHPDQPWCLGELARTTGVSARTLQDGFHRHVGMTPTRYLREVRLRRAHADLSDPAQVTTVSDTAFRWGFGHLGRFAEAYRHKFGESPSDTLRRR